MQQEKLLPDGREKFIKKRKRCRLHRKMGAKIECFGFAEAKFGGDKKMRDISPEIENLQFEMMIKLGADKRIEVACEMFAAARGLIIESLPKDLSAKEFKKQLYFSTYGEHLPEDFFRVEN